MKTLSVGKNDSRFGTGHIDDDNNSGLEILLIKLFNDRIWN